MLLKNFYKNQYVYILFLLIIYTFTALNNVGFYNDDEHFQILEPVAYLLGINNILLNDPQVQNAAEAIAKLILKSEIKSDKDRIIDLHRRITGRKPSQKALSRMIDYRDKVLELHKEKRVEMSEIDLVMKSYISLAHLIYNLDETSQKS